MKRLAAISLAAALLCGCSTTRVLSEGEYRLARNKVYIEGGSAGVKASDLAPYIMQQSNKYWFFGWNPMLNLYNWGNGSGKGFNEFCERVGVPPVVYRSDMLPKSCDNIVTRLKYLGYYNSNVTARVDTVRRLVKVTYNVTPGRQYRISDISYSLPGYGSFAEEFYRDTVNTYIRNGEMLSEMLLEKESNRSSSAMRNNGYYSFNKNNYFFVADTITVQGKTFLNYAVRDYTRNETESDAEPLVKYRFGDVSISHAEEFPFREKVLFGLNLIKPGDIYSSDVVNKTYSRLTALKVFNSVSISMAPEDSASLKCDIRLNPSKQRGVKADLKVSTNSSGLLGFSPALSFFNKNLFHGGEWFDLAFDGEFQFKYNDPSIHSNEFGVAASLSLPKIIFIPYSAYKGANIPRTDFKLSYDYQNRPEYKRNTFAFSLGLSGKLGPNLHYQISPQSFNVVSLRDLSESFAKRLERNPYMRHSYQDHFDSFVNAVFTYTTSSDLVPKDDYALARLNIDLSGNVISLWSRILPVDDNGSKLVFGLPYTQYVKSELNLTKGFYFGDNDSHSLALHFTGGIGYAYGNSSAMPFEKQFYVGGANSMRAWQARALGPGSAIADDSFSIPSQSGDIKLEADLEYRFRMFWKLEGALFLETGNVWLSKSQPGASSKGVFHLNDFYKNLAADWGFGIRANLNMILLRFDFGFKMHDPAKPEGARWCGPEDWGTDGMALHFGVGYPF